MPFVATWPECAETGSGGWWIPRKAGQLDGPIARPPSKTNEPSRRASSTLISRGAHPACSSTTPGSAFKADDLKQGGGFGGAVGVCPSRILGRSNPNQGPSATTTAPASRGADRTGHLECRPVGRRRRYILSTLIAASSRQIRAGGTAGGGARPPTSRPYQILNRGVARANDEAKTAGLRLRWPGSSTTRLSRTRAQTDWEFDSTVILPAGSSGGGHHRTEDRSRSEHTVGNTSSAAEGLPATRDLLARPAGFWRPREEPGSLVTGCTSSLVGHH